MLRPSRISNRRSVWCRTGRSIRKSRNFNFKSVQRIAIKSAELIQMYKHSPVYYHSVLWLYTPGTLDKANTDWKFEKAWLRFPDVDSVHNTTCQYGDLVRYRPRVYASHNALRAIPQAHARDSRPRAGIGPSSARFGLQHWRRTPGGQHWRPSGRVPYAIRRYCRYEPLCCQHWANCAMFAGYVLKLVLMSQIPSWWL